MAQASGGALTSQERRVVACGGEPGADGVVVMAGPVDEGLVRGVGVDPVAVVVHELARQRRGARGLCVQQQRLRLPPWRRRKGCTFQSIIVYIIK